VFKAEMAVVFFKYTALDFGLIQSIRLAILLLLNIIHRFEKTGAGSLNCALIETKGQQHLLLDFFQTPPI